MGNTTIPAELVAINAISGTLIADNAITSVHIAENNITATQIAINAVTALQMADGTITSAKIADGTIVTADIADGQITTGKLADSSVTTGKIAAGTIASSDIANNAILTQHIDDNQITADQIADNAVGVDQLAGIARGKIIVGNAAGNPSLLALGAANTLLQSDGTDLVFAPLQSGIDDNSNAVAITIDSSENVGIGTTSPTAALEVNGTIRTKLIQTTDTSLSAFTFIDLDMDTGASAGTNNLVLGGVNNVDFLIDTNNNGTSSAFVFGTNANTMSSATELMRLNESGQLGIGTSSPSRIFDVEVSGGNAIGSVVSGTGNIAGFVFGDTSADDQGGVLYNNNGDYLYMRAGGAERVRITSAGNVGIGTDAPSSALTVQGAISIRNATQSFNGGVSSEVNSSIINFGINEGSGNRFGGTYTQGSQGGFMHFDTRSGQPLFQIYGRAAGTANASGTALLDITSAGAATFNAGGTFGGAVQLNDGQLNIHSSSASAIIGSIGNTANDLNIFSSSSGHNGLRFHANGILPTNNSGSIIDNDADLGESSYRFKDLYLAGAITTGTINGFGLKAFSTSSLLISDDGNTGTINSANYNTGFGHSVFNSFTSGDYNTAIGFGSMGSAAVTGEGNVGMGMYALRYLTSGSGNVALGWDAAITLNTGSLNVAIGKLALKTSQSGSQNVAIGTQALQNFTESFNTAVGYRAMLACSSGERNTAIGHDTLVDLQTGESNTAVGHNALKIFTGSDNTAVGRNALDANISGANCTAVGEGALTTNTASHQTAVGKGAGQSLSSGSENVVVGHEAGRDGDFAAGTLVGRRAGAINTGNGNTYIGHESGTLMTSGAKNSIIGRFTGSTGGLDIRSLSNNIVISEGDGSVGFHTVVNTTSIFGHVDVTRNAATGNQILVGGGATVNLFGGTNSFSGIFLINDFTATGKVCLVMTGGGEISIIHQTSSEFVVSNDPNLNQYGIFLTSLGIKLKNGRSTAFSCRILGLRTRNQQ